MKNKIVNLVLAFCLIVPVVLMLSACGKGFEPYSVKGVSFKTPTKCEIVWEDGTTEEDKFDILGSITEEEKKQELLQDYSIIQRVQFKDDGTCVISYSNGRADSTYYFSQSEDNSEVKLWTDSSCTLKAESMIHLWGFKNEQFVAKIVEVNATIYLTFPRA